jgi:hypothetical protein
MISDAPMTRGSGGTEVTFFNCQTMPNPRQTACPAGIWHGGICISYLHYRRPGGGYWLKYNARAWNSCKIPLLLDYILTTRYHTYTHHPNWSQHYPKTQLASCQTVQRRTCREQGNREPGPMSGVGLLQELLELHELGAWSSRHSRF